MGQARKDTRFRDVVHPMSGVSPNIFYEMDSVHIQKVFDLLTDKFGFPAEWRKVWKEYLEKQPRAEDEIGLFLRFGTSRIEPILNSLLLRSPSHSTFTKMCEYVILESSKITRGVKSASRYAKK